MRLPGVLLAVVALVVAAGVSLVAPPGSSSLMPTDAWAQQTVQVPWRAGNAAAFQTGAVEEHRATAAQGSLPVTIYRPAGDGPFPFVVLLHGCGGLKYEAMWSLWVTPWMELFRERGVATAVADSFAPRGVDQVCTGAPGVWAVRRADDAYSVRHWLASQPWADPQRVAVMGMSNGGRTVLAALRASASHPEPFVAGIALYPGCQSDVASTFYAPLLVLMGGGDTVTPVRFCEQMKAAQAEGVPELTLVVYPRAPHTFDMKLADRKLLGMRLGHDAEATADARRQVVAFLGAHGMLGRVTAR
jgi:dienelactone hydrolase